MQGLLHYNHNQKCTANIFFQSFDSADGGAINVIGALAAFAAAGGDALAALKAGGTGAADLMPSAQGGFALDQACLKRCGLPETGAPGDGFGDLPRALLPLLGISSRT